MVLLAGLLHVQKGARQARGGGARLSIEQPKYPSGCHKPNHERNRGDSKSGVRIGPFAEVRWRVFFFMLAPECRADAEVVTLPRCDRAGLSGLMVLSLRHSRR